MNNSPTAAEMDRARLSHDRAYDDVFWVGVRTMKVFCRPSCPAKQPLDKNVVYYTSIADALAAGYRPCKRCRPIAGDAEKPHVTRVVTRSIESPLGELILGATERGLCLLEFADRDVLGAEIAALRKWSRGTIVAGNNRHLEQAAAELREYFQGVRTSFSVALEKPGTPFQTAVWNELLHIPYGATISYAALAAKIGHPGAQRAVGRANGDNRIAIIVPCHRVVPAHGAMKGYGGGVWRKQYLLDLERGTAVRRADGEVPSLIRPSP